MTPEQNAEENFGLNLLISVNERL